MHYPLDLRRYVKLPNGELLEILIRQRNKSHHDLSRVCEIMKAHDAKPISYITYHVDGSLHALIFLDITDLKISIDELIQELKRENIEVLETAKPKIKGVLIDTISFPLIAGKSRVIIFRDLAYSQMMQGIREKFGSGGEALLYYMGFESGKGFGKLHKEFASDIGITDPVEIYNDVSSAFFQWAGFGRIETKELTKEGGLIIVHNSFECEVMKRKTRKPYSQFVRGIITGVLNELFDKEVVVAEEMCLAKGDDFCRFKVSFKNQ